MLSPIADSSIVSIEKTGTPNGWTDDIRLTNNFTSDDNQAIGVNGNNIHVVWTSLWFGAQVYYSNSTDGGETWTPRNMISLNGFNCMNNDIEVDGNNLHVVWDDNDAINHEIKYRNSTDGGVTWNPIRMISEDDGLWSEGSKVAVNGSNIHVVWTDTRLAQTEVYYKRSTDGGITWDDALGGNVDRRITHDLSGAGPVGIEVNNSNIHVLFMDDRDGSADVYYIRSTDNGVSWDDGLGTIDEERKLTSNTTDRLGATIAVNGSDIHIAWVEQVWPGPVYYMYYQNSTDNGFSWNPIQLLSGPSPLINKPDMNVWGENVHLVWGDFRDDGSTREIYYKNSTDGGISWNTDLRLTDSETFDSVWPRIALDESTVHVTWYDDRDGNDEIYYKRFPEALPDTELPEINHVPVLSANISEIINITANITDNVGVDAVYLNYTDVGGVNHNESMTQWNGNWSYDISGQDNIGFLDYFIWCNDTSGNANMTTINSIQINDITDPEIKHAPIASANVFDVINITANITDDVAVNNVFLNYTGINGTNYNVSMNQWNDNWSFDIPGQSTFGFADYFIWANDSSDNDIKTPTYQIQIFDITDPEINHVPVTSANVGELIMITVNVTDDVSIDAVYLNYIDIAGNIYIVSMNKYNHNWSYEIAGQNDIGIVSYFILANDTSENENQTQVYQIKINDIVKPEFGLFLVSTLDDDTLNVIIEVTDDVAVDSVYFNYTDFYGINHNISMSEWNGNWNYAMSWPYQEIGEIECFFWANDTSSNENVSFPCLISMVDSYSPSVMSHTPSGSDVSVSTMISITFDESMNKTSVENAIVTSPAITISSYNWNADNTILTITPSGNQSPHTTYNVTVGIGAEDLAGNNLENPYSWEFTTEEEPGIIDPPVSNYHWWVGILIFFTSMVVLVALAILRDRKEQE